MTFKEPYTVEEAEELLHRHDEKDCFLYDVLADMIYRVENQTAYLKDLEEQVKHLRTLIR